MLTTRILETWHLLWRNSHIIITRHWKYLLLISCWKTSLWDWRKTIISSSERDSHKLFTLLNWWTWDWSLKTIYSHCFTRSCASDTQITTQAEKAIVNSTSQMIISESGSLPVSSQGWDVGPLQKVELRWWLLLLSFSTIIPSPRHNLCR